MRHSVAGRLFARTANQRKALLRGLVAALIQYERIETTVAKAKEARKIAERLVTLGKRGDLHAKRVALAKLPNRELIIKLFDEISPRFKDRNGGYTRIVHTRQRVNDRSEMAILEFVDFEDVRAKKEHKGKEGGKAKKTAKPAETEAKAEKPKKAKPEAKPTRKAEPKEKKAAKPAAKAARKTATVKKTSKSGDK